MSIDDIDTAPTGKELPADLFKLTVAELKKVAKHNNVSVSGTRKADIIFMLNEAGITNAEGVDFNDVVEPVVEAKKERKTTVGEKPPIQTGKIAIYAERNRFSSAYGRLEKGYNILNDEKVKEFWLRFPDVREATPKEVAKYYGVK